VAGRVFGGWGPSERPDPKQARAVEERVDEEHEERSRTPLLMRVTPAILLFAGAVIVTRMRVGTCSFRRGQLLSGRGLGLRVEIFNLGFAEDAVIMLDQRLNTRGDISILTSRCCSWENGRRQVG